MLLHILHFLVMILLGLVLATFRLRKLFLKWQRYYTFSFA